MPPTAKTCTTCGVSKPRSEFHRKAQATDGLNSACKSCVCEAGRKRYDLKAGKIAPAEPCGCIATEPAVASPVQQEQGVQHVTEVLTVVDEHRLKGKVRELEGKIASLVQELSDAHAMNDLAREVAASPPVAPITPREHGSMLREGTALVMASDWHIEEEVRPEAVANRNRYNVEIARQRMTRFFESTLWAIRFNRQVFKVRDCILWLGGDLITNYLHPDNVETNLLSPVQAIALAQQAIGDGIRFLLGDPELERLVIPCNDGNHGRLTDKMRAAARVDNSIEWLLYTSLAREFAGEPRVQFQIAAGAHTYLDVYDRTIRFTHGDDIRYGGGVGGITIPIMKALARWDTVRRADLTCMGHFHQLTSIRELIVNGSLIGFNAYAMSIGARFEEPAQAFHMLDPLRFKGLSIPLWVSNRDDDGGR